ncbi:acyl-CoA/acyl-ACP dehydrogenase [Vibrio sp. Of7-15]|uniref:acyl-CoA dehydrogenase family protein n=1 Tax=Vibrio sp. Of7-15 TaxID=2724879 RepID=UPI001EF3C1C7|nr:acyl-CoA dehydrogenase family protein [Vibrio sp. Of7-15]MCG7500106.1 acyl-CoA/acyl-ACP dehydrogenase [Vibrio sp. Of7-15]
MIPSFNNQLHRFARDHIEPYITQWESAGAYPQELHDMAGSKGLLRLGHDNLDQLFSDVDAAITLINTLTEHGSQGLTMGLASYLVSLSALHQHNQHNQFTQVINQVLDGEATISLAITEPHAGSDVSAITTTAQPTHSGHYEIRGQKSFICGGTRSNYFITLAKYMADDTDQEEMGLFLVHSERKTTSSDRIPTLGWQCLDVADVEFNAAKGELIADHHTCFSTLKSMLKRERINLAAMAATDASNVLEASAIYSHKRQVHGAPLHKKQAILHHLAEMKIQLTSAKAQVDNCTTAIHRGELSDEEASIAKVIATRALDTVSTLGVQVFGAKGCEVGHVSERVFRDAKILSLGGGTTEVLQNIIGKSVIKPYQKRTRQ